MRDSIADHAGGATARAVAIDHAGSSLPRSLISDLRDEAAAAPPPTLDVTDMGGAAITDMAGASILDMAA